METRLDKLESLMQSHQQAPTVPIYDPTDLPQDAVTGQIAIGSDSSFNWFDGTSWQTQAGVFSIVGNVPQDSVDGQIAIGTDGSFHWHLNGTWFTAAAQDSIEGHTPQDAIVGQVVIGTDGSLHWFA